MLGIDMLAIFLVKDGLPTVDTQINSWYPLDLPQTRHCNRRKTIEISIEADILHHKLQWTWFVESRDRTLDNEMPVCVRNKNGSGALKLWKIESNLREELTRAQSWLYWHTLVKDLVAYCRNSGVLVIFHQHCLRFILFFVFFFNHFSPDDAERPLVRRALRGGSEIERENWV